MCALLAEKLVLHYVLLIDKNILFFLMQGREEGVDGNQESFGHSSPDQSVKSFLDAVNVLKPTAIIGKA